jgi:TetR/AcrR family transcriptional regulator
VSASTPRAADGRAKPHRSPGLDERRRDADRSRARQGLYRALEEQWIANEAEVAPPDMPLDELTASHLHAVLADPRHSRLLLWEGLTGTDDEAGDASSPDSDPAVADMRRRQGQGELADDLDPSMVLIALMGAALAPVAIPQVIRRSVGLEMSDPEFERRYAEQLRRIVQRLAGHHAATDAH